MLILRSLPYCHSFSGLLAFDMVVSYNGFLSIIAILPVNISSLAIETISVVTYPYARPISKPTWREIYYPTSHEQ